MIDTFAIDGVTPEVKDEIGVFDGDLCVGSAIYQGSLPVTIAAWKDDIATPDEIDGYQPGSEMTFKFYDRSENTEYTFELPPTIQSKEDDPVRPRHSGFGAGLYAVRSLADGIIHVNQFPDQFKLGQNFPNPFNAETIIPILLPERSRIHVTVYDLLGRKVGDIYEGVLNAGNGQVRFDATSLASGMYFYRLEANGQERGKKFTDVGKMLLLK